MSNPCWSSGLSCSAVRADKPRPVARTHRVVDPGILDDLPGHAPNAGAADHHHRHLLGERGRPHADPGIGPDGQPARISLFEAFYFMSYTATTIGFGELPWPFTPAQRLWVTFSIYLSVVGWAYAIGSLLTLVQDRSFRHALALRRFTRKVARLREPFC